MPQPLTQSAAPPALRSVVPLATDGAFVVQLQADGPRGPQEFAGRVEHISSGRALRFGSTDELLAFLGQASPSVAGRADGH